jgi:3'(2'), 5'-bisphosphate nucleotidase
MQALPAWKPYASVVEAVLVASKMTEHVRRTPGFGKLTKSDASPVTVADLAAQMAVVNGINSDFPKDMIIAEEETNSLNDSGLRQEIQGIIQTFNVAVQKSF